MDSPREEGAPEPRRVTARAARGVAFENVVAKMAASRGSGRVSQRLLNHRAQPKPETSRRHLEAVARDGAEQREARRGAAQPLREEGGGYSLVVK